MPAHPAPIQQSDVKRERQGLALIPDMATDNSIKIVGLSLAVSAAWENGDRLLAFFDCEARGFRLNGCLLIKTARASLLAQGPKGDSQRVGVRAIQITDSSLRASIADAAHRAFMALGGTE